MVLHKELRVLARGTPCIIMDTKGGCFYSDFSENILTRLVNMKSSLKDSFVKRVDLVTNENEDYIKYSFNHKSFLVITVKLKEENLNENQG